MTTKWTKRSVAWVATGLTLTSAVVLLIGLTGCSQQQSAAQSQADKAAAPQAGKGGPDQPVRVKVVRPERTHLKRLSTPQPAHVGAYEKTDRYARVSGYLETFGQVKGAVGKLRPVDIGDRVVKGQVLAKLAVPELEQERLQKGALVEQAKAELEQAKASEAAAAALVDAAKAKLEESTFQVARYQADLAYRKGEYERYAALVKDRAVRGDLEEEKLNLYRAGDAAYKAALAVLATDRANIKVEQARHTKAGADVATARARLQVAQANLDHTVIMLNYATITAPYDGIITRRLVDTGDLIQSAAGKAQPLFTVSRVDRLRIIADVPEAEAGQVKVGQWAAFQVNASRGQPLSGRVVRCADALDHETRTMRTEVELDAPTQGLRPGMFGSMTILLADVPEALMLPASALLPGGGKPAVLVVEKGIARRREVEVGFNDGARVQITLGLSGDEAVIADGNKSAREGQAVEIAK